MVFEKTLTAMVKGIRAHRGKESEYINTCIQEIQKEVQSKNLGTKSMAVLKLAYLSMLGYDMTWANFSVVEVMSHNRFATKRPGYLASALCFNEKTDVGLLTINLFKKDFGSKSQYESGLALTCLSAICSPDICRDLIQDLIAMLSSSRPYLRKKTVLCLYRVFLTDPQALRTCFPKLKDRLADEDQGVLTATVNTFLELARKNAKNYLSLVPQLYHILVNTTNNWLSIKLLKVFQLLCPLEPRLPAKMESPLMNLLNSTKAQSVEFEAIRCCVRVMPEGNAVTNLAMEKLQNFLNSSDRNLRFLGLMLFNEALQYSKFKDKVAIADLHGTVLTSIEESDASARKIALQLLDKIVTPATFADTVRKLMDFSKNSSQPDEFMGTVLRMGARDRYALLEDFAWYLLILAEIARNVDTTHAEMVAEQMIDIVVRVPLVRPYAVNLALGLLDRSSTASAGNDTEAAVVNKDSSSMDLATPVVGACAYIVGEYHEAFEAPAEAMFVKAVKAMLVPKQILNLEPAIQTQCVWAATKLFLGTSKHAPGAVKETCDLLLEKLPIFMQSTQVDVAERAALSFYLANSSKGDAAKVSLGTALFEEPLLPVQADAQAGVAVPEGLDLDTPFFEVEVVPQEIKPVKSDPTDPYQLAATYKDDLGFLAAKDSYSVASQPSPSSGATSSMFYLGSKGTTNSTEGEDPKSIEGGSELKPASTDPLEQMREKLAAARASGGVKYEVMREDIPGPAKPPSTSTTATSPGVSAVSAVQALPTPPEKELTDLQGRLWSMCYRDESLGIYACVRSKNVKKQLLRIDFRCERVAQDGEPITAVSLKLPAGTSAQEADVSGSVSLIPGELQERSPKVKMNLSLSSFKAPENCTLACEIHYTRGGATSGHLELQLPATSVLSPCPMGEDSVAAYMSENSSQLVGAPSLASLSIPGKSADEVLEALPALVAKCAGLCHFSGMQHASTPGKGQKFLLVAQPPVGDLPEGSLVICLCHGIPKDAGVDVRITVKSQRKSISEDIGAQLVTIFKELVEGRLRAF